ncbi:hypothetical protein [Dickeya zeae]|uniref:hypothetical protein n=1 Tax=Dickeya zeae TaxID=204042 RepID=UPI001442E71C|nr:hypothetical protein [Dickeya zeae]
MTGILTTTIAKPYINTIKYSETDRHRENRHTAKQAGQVIIRMTMPLRCRTTSYSALLILTLVGHYSATLRDILPSDGNKQASNEYRRSDTLFIVCLPCHAPVLQIHSIWIGYCVGINKADRSKEEE